MLWRVAATVYDILFEDARAQKLVTGKNVTWT